MRQILTSNPSIEQAFTLMSSALKILDEAGEQLVAIQLATALDTLLTKFDSVDREPVEQLASNQVATAPMTMILP